MGSHKFVQVKSSGEVSFAALGFWCRPTSCLSGGVSKRSSEAGYAPKRQCTEHPSARCDRKISENLLRVLFSSLSGKFGTVKTALCTTCTVGVPRRRRFKRTWSTLVSSNSTCCHPTLVCCTFLYAHSVPRVEGPGIAWLHFQTQIRPSSIPHAPTRSIRGKRACCTAPRAMPPLAQNGGRRDTGVAPLSALNPDTLYSANEWIAGVAGGSVGVLGTLIQLELKQVRAGFEGDNRR